MDTPSVVLVEFNELCPPLMQRFMARGVLPNFTRFHGEAHVYVTEADERAPYLEPWIQWITVHTGLTYQEHQIYNLGDGHRLEAPAVWDVLSAEGLRVWVCGSMNAQYRQPINGAILPDPWTTQFQPQPPELGAYFRFVQRHVQEYTNDKVPLSPRDYLAFVSFMAQHGLSRSTVLAIARQLAEERTGRGRWKRAMLLDRMQLDVFKHYWRKLRPQFSTFFSNSTAHFQHMYWRNMEPQLFKVAPTPTEQQEYQDAIERGYRAMDRMLGEIIDMCGPRTTLVLATALSQQPCLVYEDQGGKVAHRPRDFAKLLQFAGVQGGFQISPVMTHYFHAHFDDQRAAGEAARKLAALQVGGKQAFNVEHDAAARDFMCGCILYHQLARDTDLRHAESGAAVPFFDLMYQIEGLKSGMHHPDGILWVRRPDLVHAVHPAKVPLQHVAPMLLEMFSVKRPATMRAEPLGGFARLAAS